MNRIVRKSQRFRWFFLCVFVAIPLLQILAWLNLESLLDSNLSYSLVPEMLERVDLSTEFTWEAKALGLVGAMITSGFQMAALWLLARLFGEFSKGELFTRTTVRLLSRVGWLILIAHALSPVSEMVTTLALTLGNPEGERMISLSLSDGDIMGVVLGLALVFAAQILDEARALREADALTI